MKRHVLKHFCAFVEEKKLLQNSFNQISKSFILEAFNLQWIIKELINN